MSEKPTVSVGMGGEALQTFQLSVQSIKSKSSKDYGLAISKYIASTASFNTSGYYFNRNARIIKNRRYSSGTIDIKEMFRDRFQFNAKQNYIALNWNALQIVNRITSGLIGRWMNRNEKIVVKAIDSLSQTQKEEEYNELLFIIENRQKIEELQQQSGVQLIPNDELPEDKEQLNIWRTELQRLPEEIIIEKTSNDVLASNGFYDTQKEKCLEDISITGLGGTYVWMDNTGVIHVRRIRPEDSIYSWSEQNDLRDTSWRGEVITIKISEIRRQWGKEFNPNNPYALTENEIWEKVIPHCKEYQYQTNIGQNWNESWVSSLMRPYDEWNVLSIQFELKTVDSEPYTVTTTKTKSVYIQKGLPKTKSGKEKETALNQNIIGDTNWNIYRGVYLPDCNVLLEWGIKTNMIRPQDPKEIGNAEFSYSFVMPQNYQGRNLAIPEKIEAAIDGMILACLKIQQDIATSIPPGWVIDETGLQNIDYGLGESGNKSVDQSRLFFQTGKLFYRGIDMEGNRIPVPIQEVANSGFAVHIDAFIRTYQFWYQSLKDELGEDPNLISAALQPRVTQGNVQASQINSQFATDYYYRSYADLMIQTSRKITCLLKDSVTYGAKAYRELINKQDVDNRIFSTEIRFLPTDVEVQQFDFDLQQAMNNSPQLSLFINPMQLRRIAKEDVKMAETLYRQGQKKMILWQQQTAAQNQQQTIEGQIKSAKVAEEEKRITKDLDIQGEIKKSQNISQGNNQSAVINMVAALLKPNAQGQIATIPPDIKELVNAVIDNVILGSVVEVGEKKQELLQRMQQARAMQQQENAQEENEQPEGDEINEMPDENEQYEMMANQMAEQQ